MPNLSIAAVTYRSKEETKAFLNSIFENTRGDFELILGVNGTKDDELMEYVVGLENKLDKGRFRLCVNPENIGVRAFNQVMRMAQSDFVFRLDSDVVIRDPYWTQRMIGQWKTSNDSVGSVAAVGTSNTQGYMIQRNPTTVETDWIPSSCMMIHVPTAQKIRRCLRDELPRMEKFVAEKMKSAENYPHEHDDLLCTLEYAKYHAPWWDLWWGGKENVCGYGADDMHWSLLARWAGLKLVKSAAMVEHKDSSMRPGYSETRHGLVSRAFQYMRTSLSLVMDVWSQDDWKELPFQLPVLKNYRASGEPLIAK